MWTKYREAENSNAGLLIILAWIDAKESEYIGSNFGQAMVLMKDEIAHRVHVTTEILR
jgi:hypothetical protein